ncbi:MAG: T9SS type A sorting domain-containing protein [Moheibacter sp.]
MKKISILLTGLAFSVGFGQMVITHSVDAETIDTGGVACWANTTGEYRDNAFARAYVMNEYVDGNFVVSAVQFGQGSADEGKFIEVNIYTVTDEFLDTAEFTLLATASTNLSAAGDMSLIELPIDAVIPAGSTVAVEVFAQDEGDVVMQRYFPGFNLAGETGTPWLKSDGCSIWWTDANTVVAGSPQPYVINLVGEENMGVTEVIGTSFLSVSPNPATDVVNISMKGGMEAASVSIVNLAGQNVYTSKATNSVNVSFLPAGVYVVKVIDTKGATHTTKIVKK